MSRPESIGHAALFYNAKEARKYDSSSRMMGVQREITERALELLKLSPSSSSSSSNPQLILDIGCGSGLSGQVLEEYGHVWVGCDISRDMLQVAKERMMERVTDNTSDDDNDNDDDDSDDEDESNNNNVRMQDNAPPSAKIRSNNNKQQQDPFSCHGDLIHHDMGTGLPFRAATFDACISISALQWLCYSNSKNQIPKQRLTRFFSSLYSVLKRSGRAVLQFYPETADQAVLISQIATQVGFAGGIVVDYPNSAKAKKHYLVLTCNRGNHNTNNHSSMANMDMTNSCLPDGSLHHHAAATAQVSSSERATTTKTSTKLPPRKKKGGVKTKEWILHKKQTQRQKGKAVRPDTKYTARRRPTKF